jgi:E3 ubiquitin-protein ligase HUWE1
LTSEDPDTSSLFLYEPTIIAQLADLLAPNFDPVVQYAAVTALDACSRHRAKISEVLAALGANLTHGCLLELFRRITRRLVENGENGGYMSGSFLTTENVAYDLVDAVFGLIANLSNTPTHCQILVGAGILPILLDLTQTRCDRRDNVSS